jgi:hypothetical protein
MNTDNFLGFIIGTCTMGAIAATIMVTSDSLEDKQIKAEAVAAGVAEWIVSYDSNGSPVLEFRWKTENQKL